MATLLHFLRPLAATFCAGFSLSLCVLSGTLGGGGGGGGSLMLLAASPLGLVLNPVYVQTSRFLTAFGAGDRLEGIIAISLTLGFVAALLNSFTTYKRCQRSEWRLAANESFQ